VTGVCERRKPAGDRERRPTGDRERRRPATSDSRPATWLASGYVIDDRERRRRATATTVGRPAAGGGS
jgi:hypothetical protein